jgi:hypothetical protein
VRTALTEPSLPAPPEGGKGDGAAGAHPFTSGGAQVLGLIFKELPTNSADEAIFYSEGGELSSNRLEDQELSVLSLHLLQLCLVYVNTLMIQRVLGEPTWRQRMQVVDYRALSPLIYAHINPYGRFDLDMDKRIPIEAYLEMAN